MLNVKALKRHFAEQLKALKFGADFACAKLSGEYPVKFFGVRYSSAAYLECERVQAPVGERCARCDEPIAENDDGWLIPYLGTAADPRELAYHRACHLRGIVGSVAHQQGRCSCFVPGSIFEDDPALTARQAAEAAEAYFEAHLNGPLN
jgi:hypothetical protein